MAFIRSYAANVQHFKLDPKPFKEFEMWKSDVESNNATQYVLPSGEKIDKDGRKVSYYQCNRSGLYKCMAKKRLVKSSGTRKIAKNCTSTLKVTQTVDGHVIVNACYSHYGHKNEIQHISLSSVQRQEIACKLKMGVTKDRILNDIRDETSCVQSRLHLTQRQDIKNLEKAFNINSIQLHANDQDSVAIWLKEWQMKTNSPVLYYKLQGVLDTCNTFKESDFIIIMQTEHQKKMLQQFGKNGVCIDSTHGTNAYDFLLTSMLVVDELGEGQPVGWCIANSDSFRFLKIFFIKLQEHSGSFCPKWIMSDLASQYYEAFCDVYLCAPLKFWCTWHVDKAWREELHKKVHNLEMEADIYKQIRFVLQLSDKNLFDDYLNSLMGYLQSSVLTQMFAEYFEKYWVNNKHIWAFCYRMGHGINTNMYMESFHKVFKYSYLQGKHNKRIDNCLFALLKFNRDKVYERIIKLTKGKISYKLKMVHSRHIASLQLCESFTKDDKGAWLIPSETNACHYRVVIHQKLCDITECFTKCPECKVCTHLYSCDCMDFLTKNIPCKHIHLVHRHSNPSILTTTIPLDFPTSSIELDCKIIKGCEPADINILKDSIIRSLKNLANLVSVSSISDEDSLQTLQKNISLAKNTFLSLTTNKQNELHIKSKVPSYKTITKQPTFYSTKRKRKTSNFRLAKPSATEINNLLDISNWTMKTKETHLQSPSKLTKAKLGTTSNSNIKTNILSIEQRKVLELFAYKKPTISNTLTIKDLRLDDNFPHPEILNHDISIVKELINPDVFEMVQTKLLHLEQSWSCSICSTPQYKDMIECEVCETWYHWICVSLSETVGDVHWICHKCDSKKVVRVE
nr:uncharacterized protein LOC124812015 isoform X2 [Hydra vulgaris]